MTNPKGGSLALQQLAELSQMTVEDVLRIVSDDSLTPKPVQFARLFSFSDALEIEIARQMNDNNGVPLNEAFRLSVYTAALASYGVHNTSGSSQDFWMAVAASRNTWGTEPRGIWPITGFGPKEYWAELHFTGALGAITSEISEWIGRDRVQHPDSDPARIIMCNVSAADRRLRKRAADLGLKIVGANFA